MPELMTYEDKDNDNFIQTFWAEFDFVSFEKSPRAELKSKVVEPAATDRTRISLKVRFKKFNEFLCSWIEWCNEHLS